ncbi:MAG TPA: hypothetical protein VJM11_01125 [Nevskiaceae bacterium]|nr:hypothetical protein [Nevskiaceae bacterium]
MNIRMVVLVAAATTIAACGSGSSRDGLQAHVSVVPQGSASEAKAEHTIKSFRRGDGLRIDLQLGLVNVAPIALEPCGADVARWLDRLNPLGAAVAHGGDDELPASLVDVMHEDGEAFELGSIGAEPGTYCGLVIALQPGDAEELKHGGELDESMAGALVNVAPCYYPGTEGLSDEDAAAAHDHHCVQAKLLGEERTVTLPLPAPVTLDADRRDVALTVVARYEAWFEDLDMELLPTDAAQQSKLGDNVAAAMEVIAAGTD